MHLGGTFTGKQACWGTTRIINTPSWWMESVRLYYWLLFAQCNVYQSRWRLRARQKCKGRYLGIIRSVSYTHCFGIVKIKASHVPKKCITVTGSVVLICWEIFIEIWSSLQKRRQRQCLGELFRQVHRSDYFTSVVPNLGVGTQTTGHKKKRGCEALKRIGQRKKIYTAFSIYLENCAIVSSLQTPLWLTELVASCDEGLRVDLLHSKRLQAWTTALHYQYCLWSWLK